MVRGGHTREGKNLLVGLVGLGFRFKEGLGDLFLQVKAGVEGCNLEGFPCWHLYKNFHLHHHQLPTGRFCTKENRGKLVEWISRLQTWISESHFGWSVLIVGEDFVEKIVISVASGKRHRQQIKRATSNISNELYLLSTITTGYFSFVSPTPKPPNPGKVISGFSGGDR